MSLDSAHMNISMYKYTTREIDDKRGRYIHPTRNCRHIAIVRSVLLSVRIFNYAYRPCLGESEWGKKGNPAAAPEFPGEFAGKSPGRWTSREIDRAISRDVGRGTQVTGEFPVEFHGIRDFPGKPLEVGRGSRFPAKFPAQSVAPDAWSFARELILIN